MDNKNDLVHPEEEDSSANREYWIKTDADCKHATTFHNSYIYAFQFNYRIWWFTWWKYQVTVTEKIIYSMSIFSFSFVTEKVPIADLVLELWGTVKKMLCVHKMSFSISVN